MKYPNWNEYDSAKKWKAVADEVNLETNNATTKALTNMIKYLAYEAAHLRAELYKEVYKAEAEVERLRNENAKLKKALELANSNRMCTECKLLVYCFNKSRHTMPKGCVESWLEQAELEDGK